MVGDLEKGTKIMPLETVPETDGEKRFRSHGAKGSGNMLTMAAAFSTLQVFDKHH